MINSKSSYYPYCIDNKSVLFISHDASHTGAPIFLLNFLRWFKKNTSIPFYILIGDGGPLIPDFKSLGHIYFFQHPDLLTNFPSISKNHHFHTIAQKVHLRSLINKLGKSNIGLIYSNTITNGQVLENLLSLDCPVITHVHEMEYLIKRYGDKNFQLIKYHTDKYIAVSEAVKENLIYNHSISSEDIEVIHGCIPLNQMDNICFDITACKRIVTSELNIPADSFLIGASGNFNWIKGVDLFIQLAKEMITKKPDMPIHFVWLGGDTSSLRFQELLHDIKQLCIHKNIHFLGHKQNPLLYYSSFDVFAILSREDSFPLACLEAASVKTPILCFDNTGGAKEFVQNDCGFVIPYLNISVMTHKLINLMESLDLRNRMAARAAQKVKENFNLQLGANKILKEIEKFIQ
jgi:glycosyltransferase involved in cell wall biosynthesis